MMRNENRFKNKQEENNQQLKNQQEDNQEEKTATDNQWVSTNKNNQEE